MEQEARTVVEKMETYRRTVIELNEKNLRIPDFKVLGLASD